MTLSFADTPVLETDRLTLRAFDARDIELGMAFLQSPRAEYIGGPYSAHDAWTQCCHLIGHWAARGYGLFTMCLKGTDTAIGDAGPYYPHGWAEPEIAWSMWSPDFEGNGYAFEAATATRRWVYETLGWTTVTSYIESANTRSIALAKRMSCTLDPAGALPDLPDWDGTLVFRHPAAAEVLQ